MGEGSTIITPASPSMMTQSSRRTSWLAARAHHGRNVHAARHDGGARSSTTSSVTNPANTLCLNCSMSAGDGSCATSTRGTSTVSSSSRSCCVLRRWLTGRHGAGHALHVTQDALDHLLQVGLAFAQVLVLHLVELARNHLQLGGQRPFGVVQALGNPVLDALFQGPRPAAASGAHPAARPTRAGRRRACRPAGAAARPPPCCGPGARARSRPPPARAG